MKSTKNPGVTWLKTIMEMAERENWGDSATVDKSDIEIFREEVERKRSNT